MSRSWIVTGRYADGSGESEQAYGPYPKDKADEIASALTAGAWECMEWSARPLQATPWETARPTVLRGTTTPRTVPLVDEDDDEDQGPIYDDDPES